MTRLKMGTDPEVFVVAPPVIEGVKEGVSCLPAYYALGGTVHDLPNGKLVGDGAAIEYSVNPSNDAHELATRVHANLEAARQIVSGITPGAMLSTAPWIAVDPAYIAALPKRMGPAWSLQILGCAPDQNVYGLHVERPDPRVYNGRTSGGHIHVEVPPAMLEDTATATYLTVAYDMTLNALGVIRHGADPAFRERLVLYGAPGFVRFAEKYSTLEYRCLPAVALLESAQAAEAFFNIAGTIRDVVVDTWTKSQVEAVTLLTNLIGSLDGVLDHLIPALSTGNVDVAREFLKQFLGRAQDHMKLDPYVNALATI